MIKYLENEDFNDLIKEGTVLVDFYADWCGPCKMLAPELESLSNERSEVSIIKVDTDKHEDIARGFGIMSIPTIHLYKDGVLKDKIVGFMPKDELVKLINKA